MFQFQQQSQSWCDAVPPSSSSLSRASTFHRETFFSAPYLIPSWLCCRGHVVTGHPSRRPSFVLRHPNGRGANLLLTPEPRRFSRVSGQCEMAISTCREPKLGERTHLSPLLWPKIAEPCQVADLVSYQPRTRYRHCLNPSCLARPAAAALPLAFTSTAGQRSSFMVAQTELHEKTNSISIPPDSFQPSQQTC